MNHRQTTIHLTQDDLSDLNENLGGREAAAIDAALGRLSRWGLGGEAYRYCNIYRDGKTGLMAGYYDTDPTLTAPRPRFVMAAVWDGSKFGYHS